jgi:hypothetical protein
MQGKISVFLRLSEVNWPVRPPPARAKRASPLPNTLRGAILVGQSLGIGGMSVNIRYSAAGLSGKPVRKLLQAGSAEQRTRSVTG